jgi:hypothetical protein
MNRGFAVAGVLLLFIGGTALATQWPSQDGELHGCVQKNSGDLRLVSANDTCKNNEDSVTWNIQGATGPQGPPGAAGPAGKGGIVWKDSTGTVVPIVDRSPAITDAGTTTSTVTFRFVDTNTGTIWAYTPPYQPQVGPVNNFLGMPFSVPSLYYASANCSGPAYFDVNDVFMARETYQLGTEVRTVPDNGPTASVNVGSKQEGWTSVNANDGFCVPASGTLTAIAVASTTVVTAPSFPYVPPFHEELAQ